jgi:CheY-like chemotaxis protein
MFFGSIPQELTFYGPAPVATFTPTTVRISIPDEEEASITLTPKGISNNVMASPTNSPRRRRRPSKKAVPVTVAKTAHNSQASRKRALDAYQNQLVARPAIPVSNQFTTLRIVAKNSATGQLRQAWEVPKPAPQPAQTKAFLHRQHKSQASAEAIYKAHRALKQRKSVRNAKSRQYVSRSSQSRDMAQPQAIIPASRPRRFTSKATPDVQQVWVPKGSQPTKPQSQIQPRQLKRSVRECIQPPRSKECIQPIRLENTTQ